MDEQWRFKAKAVTKYSSELYDAQGVYAGTEWTSRSDIGKQMDIVTQQLLNEERYLEVEQHYIQAVMIFMDEVRATAFRITDLHKTSEPEDFRKWADEDLYDAYLKLACKDYKTNRVDVIMQLVLREYVQLAIQLITPEMDSGVYFGYDYYMYFVSDSADFRTLEIRLSPLQMYIS